MTDSVALPASVWKDHSLLFNCEAALHNLWVSTKPEKITITADDCKDTGVNVCTPLKHPLALAIAKC